MRTGRPLLAVLPEVVEHREGDHQLLVGRGEATEIDHGRVGAIVDDVGDAAPSPRPRPPSRARRDSRAASPATAMRSGSSRRMGRHQSSIEAADANVVVQVQQRVVLLAVERRGSSRSTAACDGRSACRGIAPAAARPRRAVGSTRMSRCASASAVGPGCALGSSPSRTKSEFGSKITTGSAVCGDDLLEHDAERIGLARAALPAPERVPVEPVRQQLRRAARVGQVRADLQQRAGGRVQHLDGRGIDLLDGPLVERVAASGVEPAIGEHPDEAPAEPRRLRSRSAPRRARAAAHHRPRR